MKVKNLRRDPGVFLCVISDGFFGDWVQLDGTASIVHSLPDAMEPLVEYYRSLSGEHPDWDDYRAAMVRDRRVIVRVPRSSAPVPTSAAEGPVGPGGRSAAGQPGRFSRRAARRSRRT